jgi:hypothetical protein
VVSVARLQRRRWVSAAGIAHRRILCGQWLRVVDVLLEPGCKRAPKQASEVRRENKGRIELERGLGVVGAHRNPVEARQRLQCFELWCEQPGGVSEKLEEGKCGGGGLLIAHGVSKKQQGINGIEGGGNARARALRALISARGGRR